VRRRRRDAEVPGGQVPGDGTHQAADQDGQREDGLDVSQGDELANGVGYRRSAQQGAEKLESADDDHRLHRGHRTRRNDRRHDVGGIMKAVGVVEKKDDGDSDYRQYQ
jgi:hypothetical protein